ncbi:hypothetical protein OG381_27660 [Streptomyces sp. NBC_00490]|uniref:hypothetical protein n=1 Tax=Streptomyces sp. NBC_00490 TaxID=2903657 RepID=UPI002E18B067
MTEFNHVFDLLGQQEDRIRWLGGGSAMRLSVRCRGSPALPLALLAGHGQQGACVPGRTVNRMTGAYRGEAKVDVSVAKSGTSSLEVSGSGRVVGRGNPREGKDHH